MSYSETPTPLVLEFFGLPGSGKTSVTKVLAQRLHRASLRIEHYSDEARRRRLSLKYAECYSRALLRTAIPLSALSWLRILLKLRRLSLSLRNSGDVLYRRRRLLCVIKELLKRIAAETSLKHDAILFDQNVVQALSSLTFDDIDLPKDPLTNLLCTLFHTRPNTCKHVFVFVQCDPETALARIYAREKRLHLPPSFHAADTPFASTISLYNTVCSVLRNSPHHLISLEHGPAPEQLALSVNEYLSARNLLNSSPITPHASK